MKKFLTGTQFFMPFLMAKKSRKIKCFPQYRSIRLRVFQEQPQELRIISLNTTKQFKKELKQTRDCSILEEGVKTALLAAQEKCASTTYLT